MNISVHICTQTHTCFSYGPRSASATVGSCSAVSVCAHLPWPRPPHTSEPSHIITGWYYPSVKPDADRAVLFITECWSEKKTHPSLPRHHHLVIFPSTWKIILNRVISLEHKCNLKFLTINLYGYVYMVCMYAWNIICFLYYYYNMVHSFIIIFIYL